MAGKVKTNEFVLISPNGLIEKILSVDVNGVVKIDGVKVPSENDLLGVNQTWTNVTSSRVLGTTYTNNTGKPIMIAVSTKTTSGSYAFLQVNINGAGVFPFAGDASPSGATWISGTIIIPVGATYSVTADTGTLNTWFELR